VLLKLSKDAISSDWVEREVTRVLADEHERQCTLLFPIRIDDAVLETREAWARLLRGQRHIGDFTRWKDHDRVAARGEEADLPGASQRGVPDPAERLVAGDAVSASRPFSPHSPDDGSIGCGSETGITINRLI
jgi:hypothetical protein